MMDDSWIDLEACQKQSRCNAWSCSSWIVRTLLTVPLIYYLPLYLSLPVIDILLLSCDYQLVSLILCVVALHFSIDSLRRYMLLLVFYRAVNLMNHLLLRWIKAKFFAKNLKLKVLSLRQRYLQTLSISLQVKTTPNVTLDSAPDLLLSLPTHLLLKPDSKQLLDERAFLLHALSTTNQLFSNLASILHLFGIILIVLLFNNYYYSVTASYYPQLLCLVLNANVLRPWMWTYVQCLHLVFLTHPFDAGDLLTVSGESYKILELGIMWCKMRCLKDDSLLYYPNVLFLDTPLVISKVQ